MISLKTLHNLEIKTLPFIKDNILLSELIKSSNLKDVEVMRVTQWLENKELLKTQDKITESYELTSKGKEAKEKGLPEIRFLKALESGKKSKDDINKELKKLKLPELTPPEFGVSVGLLKKNDLIIVSDGFERTKVKPDFNIEKILADPKEDSEAIQRGLIAKNIRKDKIITITKDLTRLQNELKKSGSFETIDRLTPEMLKNGSWKDKEFREYDVDINFSTGSVGRRHPTIEANNILRDIFIEMGFEEMEGPMVESEFWCFDTMWIPQDHPARDEQDTFFLDGNAKVPKDLMKKVKIMHEQGIKRTHTIKDGWSEKITTRRILRTHSTATSFRTLFELGKKHAKGENIDGKYFYVANNFRNEAVDATHLAEFFQAEGVIIGDNLSLAGLMGFIKEYYSKLGINKIKFKPTFNPYTEPSMEAHYYDEKMGKWYALINSGIFRPETLEPMGLKGKTIFGFGMGASRVATLLSKKTSMRDITGHTCDFEWLRTRPLMNRNIIR